MSSNAFHPATIGALYGVLAAHEQALAQWALAAQLTQADVDGETADRYAAVVDDVKRLITLAEPDLDDHMPIEGIERNLRAHALMGRLMRELSDFRLSNWETDGSCSADIRAMLHRSSGGSRAAARAIAERLGLVYGSKLFDPSNGASDYVTASGELDGFTVEIWSILPIEQQVDHAAGIPCSDSPCPICVELQEQQQPGAEQDDLDDSGDDAPEGRFTDAQLDGTACSECGGDFAEGVATVPTGLVIDGGQLFAHRDCLADTNPTEPGVAP